MTIHDTFWLAAKRKGFIRFTVETGLPFGLIMFIATGFIYEQFSSGLFTFDVLKNLLIWLTGGVVFGGYQWFSLKRKAENWANNT
ncbi:MULTISPECIES: hypothetical protein [Vibrio]|uniref:hypothetical protein n=1 Tax=Vibrio TaxID=662 RepID=UPI00041B08DD|nr:MULTISPECIES: hypothetical protein [Vibrio]MCR9673567.1 hypothetical protein [Vibrio alginolyticus]HCE1503678.1 hypothetical protein [Vibrio parahaemolyticus]MCE9846405.1 hypothetical protein [Vibrio antiquarius]MCS0357730.1 hypothetical protein [Vibrio diabolicus]MDW1900681.1 hypothetical protein [Vibrio sp. Vb1337]